MAVLPCRGGWDAMKYSVYACAACCPAGSLLEPQNMLYNMLQVWLSRLKFLSFLYGVRIWKGPCLQAFSESSHGTQRHEDSCGCLWIAI